MMLVLASGCGDDGASAVGSEGSGPAESTTQASSSSAASADTSSGAITSDASTTSGSPATTSTTSTSTTSTGTTSGTTDDDTTTHGSTTTSTSEGSGSSGDEGVACVLPDDSSSGDEGAPLDLGVEGGCGNGVVEGDEFCDDGNAIGGDGCENDCTSSDDVLPLFSVTMGGPLGYPDCATGVVFDSENNLILGGYISDDIWIRKYDQNYEEVWTTIYDGHPGAGCYVPVAVDSNDNIAFAGPAGLEPNADWLFGLLDPDGMELWTDTLDGPVSRNDYPRHIAVDSDDSVIVVGGRENPINLAARGKRLAATTPSGNHACGAEGVLSRTLASARGQA